METGQRGATPRDIRDLCDLYQLTTRRSAIASQLAAEGKQQGWWQSYELDFATYVGFEQATVSIKHFAWDDSHGIAADPRVCPCHALRQASRTSNPSGRALVAVCSRRQAILLTGQPPLRLHVVLDEATLHRAVGGPKVMAEQLGRMVELAEWPNITIQVIPFAGRRTRPWTVTSRFSNSKNPRPTWCTLRDWWGSSWNGRRTSFGITWYSNVCAKWH